MFISLAYFIAKSTSILSFESLILYSFLESGTGYFNLDADLMTFADYSSSI